MSLTDKELLMLEQLTYYNERGLGPIKTTNKRGNLGELLDSIDLEEVEKINSDTFDGKEWAAMIRYMKTNTNIRNLRVKQVIPDKGKTDRILFEDSNNNAIVAFRGTVDKNEWADNMEGLNRADTNCQKEALDYINGLDYENITVVGHSKGGNKAQYVAILSDKVDRCVSMDGQGFSAQFIETYRDEILKNSGKIKCYSLSTDFVHVLLYPIPGVQQIYIRGGEDVSGIKEHHTPNSLFEYYIDENGDMQIMVKDGEIYLPIGTESPSVALLRNFSIFLMENATEEDLQEIVEFLTCAFRQGLGKAIEEKLEGLKDLLVYLLKFIIVNDIDIDDIINLLNDLGLTETIISFLRDKLKITLPLGIDNYIFLLRELFEQMIKIITVGAPIGFILEELFELIGWEFTDIIELYMRIRVEHTTIIVPSSGKNRDYSQKTYDTLMEAIKSFQNMSLPGVGGWKVYSGAEWFGKVSAAVAIMCINTYADKLEEINSICKKRVDRVFSNISNIDDKYRGRMYGKKNDLKDLKIKIEEITMRIS